MFRRVLPPPGAKDARPPLPTLRELQNERIPEASQSRPPSRNLNLARQLRNNGQWGDTGGTYYPGGGATWHPHQWSLRDSLAWFPAARLSIPVLAEQDPRIPQSEPHGSPDGLLKLGLLCAVQTPGEGWLRRLPLPHLGCCPACPDCFFLVSQGDSAQLVSLCPNLPFLRHPASPPSCKPRVQDRHDTLVWCLLYPSSLQRGLNAGSSLSHFKSTPPHASQLLF